MKARKLLLIAFLCVNFVGAKHANAYRLNSRWTATATDGAGLSQGDPTTIRWSVIPDGTLISGEGPSGLVSMLNTEFGSIATWQPLIEQAFSRWDELSGLSTVYEPNDDGATMSSARPGVLGVRGDVRLGGVFMDGSGGVLAYNYFPNFGDMVIDTGDGNLFDNSANNFRTFRNVISHEHGHGLGISHVESNNSQHLMEPFLATTFDGPQFDDLLAVQRGYGDIFEENGGNDSASNATPLGTIPSGSTVSIGTSATGTTAIPATATDFVSIDDNLDFDFYAVTVTSASEFDITLDPRGPTYNEGCQGCSQSSYNTRALSNLSLQLYDTDGTTLLSSANSNGAGVGESLNGIMVGSAGTYYVRVSGSANDVQMYRLDVSAESVALPGDFDNDGDYACADIDALVAAVAGGSTDLQWDLNSDNDVDADDVDEWLAIAGAAENASGNPYLPGDASLDGVVDALDFAIWSLNRFTSNTAWCAANFDANSVIDASDFAIWSQNRFTSSVPEPTFAVWGLLSLVAVFGRKR